MSKQEHWFSLVAEQEQSDYSITAFCTARGIKLPTFHYWRKKFKETKAPDRGFVDITPARLQDSPIRIAYSNGVNLHMTTVDLSLIAHLIRLG